jgi:Ni/Fe-hydrogenase subunit HybB-like protein
MKTYARPLGGKLLTPFFRVLLLVWAAGTAVLLVRVVNGLGAVTALNDGYPWGLWIAVDVAVGTGLASGGYAVALLVYAFHRGQHHPLVRPALVTSFLGYTAAASATVFDLGRYWNLWKVPLTPWSWNFSSILLQVALCEMAYVAVLALEIAPAFLERWRDAREGALSRFSERVLPGLERALPFVIALGLLLPVMHQAGLGSLLLVAVTKLHPMWHTPFLPLLFVVTSLAMGYAVVCVESMLTSLAFGRRFETRLLGSIGLVVAGTLVAFLAVRFASLAMAGRLGLVLSSGGLSFAFLGETILCAVAAALFLRPATRRNAGLVVQAAFLALGGTALYRMDVFFTAFDPGPGWTYFPSLGEIAITAGLVATETMIYLVLVRKLPVLGAGAVRRIEPLPAAAAAAAAHAAAR